jgi:uncharacterized protein involved in type VI secretion and phage assembly
LHLTEARTARQKSARRDSWRDSIDDNFDFLSRLFAEEGIHFHLEHGNEKTVVILVNDSRGYGAGRNPTSRPWGQAGVGGRQPWGTNKIVASSRALLNLGGG